MGHEREEPDSGHEPEETHDERFAPVLHGADARGRTRAGEGRPEGDPDEEATGTGVPGEPADHPATLPPDTEGVERAERRDATRRHD